MKDFTIIPNNLLQKSQLSISARYLHCVLLRYCGQDEKCFPGQKKLANDFGYSARHIRNLLNELIEAGLVQKRRKGWNKTNTYTVAKNLEIDRKCSSPHIRNVFPFHQGNEVPNKNTYLKEKDKRDVKGFEELRKSLIENRILKYK